MKKLVLIALVLGGCVADLPLEQSPGSTDSTERPAVDGTILAATDIEILREHHGPREVATVEISTAARGFHLATACSQAARLPISNVCSMLCDPDRVVARTISDGSEHGSCTDYHCAFAGDVDVKIGVCLP